jgi:hypothetical protein
MKIDQQKHYPSTATGSWQYITYLKKADGTDSLPYFYCGDALMVEFTAECNGLSILNDTTIVDAIMLIRDGSTDTIIIDDDDPGFTTHNDYMRTYLSMQDDGGISKTPFYLLQACHISMFNFYNDLGLLYAMGQKGLISLGASSSDFEYCYKNLFTEALTNGKNFGRAFKEQVQWHGIDRLDLSYSLIGAGTLKSKAYIPYSDYDSLNITGITISNYKELYVKKKVTISSNVIVNGTGTLKIISGEDIIITPDFLADYGSKLDLKVIKSLY